VAPNMFEKAENMFHGGRKLRSNLSGNSDSDFPLPSQQPILKRQKPVPDGGELTLNFHEKGVGIFINVEVTPIGVLRETGTQS